MPNFSGPSQNTDYIYVLRKLAKLYEGWRRLSYNPFGCAILGALELPAIARGDRGILRLSQQAALQGARFHRKVAGNSMAEPVTYRRRRGAVSRTEREWRVEDDALVTRGGSGREKRYRWSDIVSVRLLHRPVRSRPWRYVFELQPKHARKIVIDNAHYTGQRSFEERSETYTPFVRAAVARWAAVHPKGRALIGETPKRYFFLTIAALLGLGALAYALVVIPTPLDSLAYAPAIKLGVILLMLPFFWRAVIKAIPRGVAPDAIPDRALPPNSNSG